MNYQIKGGVVIGLRINESQIDMRGCSFSHFTIRESIYYSLPTLDFVLFDYAGQIPSGSVTHGTKVQVLFGDEVSGEAAWYRFTVFNNTPVASRDTGGVTYTISCVYEAYDYIFDKKAFSIESTSGGVVAMIAARNGMKSEVDPTQDRQIWFNTHMTQSRFLQDVVTDTAYLNDTSVFRLGYSLGDNTLILRNLAKIKGSVYTPVVSNILELNPDLLFTEYSFQNSGGQTSVVDGVAGVSTHEKDLITGDQSLYSKVKVTVNNKGINITDGIAGSVKTKVRMAPLNMGNTHDNKQRATNQNRRLNALYSMQVEVLVHKFTTLRLFDPVTMHFMDPSTNQSDPATEGMYLLAARGRCALMNQYAEKLVFIRNSLNNGG